MKIMQSGMQKIRNCESFSVNWCLSYKFIGFPVKLRKHPDILNNVCRGVSLSTYSCTIRFFTLPFPVHLPNRPDGVLSRLLPHCHRCFAVHQLQDLALGGSLIHAVLNGLAASGLVVIFVCHIGAVVGFPVDLHELIGHVG